MIYRVYSIILIALLFSNGFSSLTPASIKNKRLSLAMDIIPSLSLNSEYGLNNKFGIGCSIGLFNNEKQVFSKNFIHEDGESYLETHILYNFQKYSNDMPMDISIIGGMWGTGSKLVLQLGLLLDIPLSRQFNARFNLIFGPRAGIEIAYLIKNNIELNVDLAIGAGILGLRYYL